MPTKKELQDEVLYLQMKLKRMEKELLIERGKRVDLEKILESKDWRIKPAPPRED